MPDDARLTFSVPDGMNGQDLVILIDTALSMVVDDCAECEKQAMDAHEAEEWREKRKLYESIYIVEDE